MNLKNKKILISGANRGIGKSLVRLLAAEGVHLGLILRKKEDQLNEELQRLGATSVVQFECDLTDLDSLKSISSQLELFNPDILFNNAGLLTGGLLEEQKWEEIHNMLLVNVHALIYLTRLILPGMLQRKFGKIINHGSVSSVMFFPCASTYAASKAAVLAFTESLATELEHTGVSTLLLLTPGVKTEMFDQIQPLYGKHIEMKIPSVVPEVYAKQILDAIKTEIGVLSPKGLTGINMLLARHFPLIFKKLASSKFRRD